MAIFPYDIRGLRRFLNIDFVGSAPKSYVCELFVFRNSLLIPAGALVAFLIFEGHEDGARSCELFKILVFQVIDFFLKFSLQSPFFCFYGSTTLAK